MNLQKKLLCLALIFSPLSYADVSCSGSVKNVALYAGGNVLISTEYRNDNTVICNVQSPWKGISAETCRSMLSTVLVAQTSKQDLMVYYAGDNLTCKNIPTYSSAPAPSYVGVKGL